MPRKIAVVTDAVSSLFLFQTWWNYYVDQFGSDSIYIITYKGMRNEFANISPGGIIELPSEYNDTVRANYISSFITSLLSVYDAVVRVDLDEMLVVKGGGRHGLRDYLNEVDYPYISARGFDLIAIPNDTRLDLSKPILISQRRFAYSNTALNKVCYVRIPTKWREGFHTCNLYPNLDQVFLFHLKFSDIDMQLAWRAKITDLLAESESDVSNLRRYYKPDYERLLAHCKGRLAFPLEQGYTALNKLNLDADFFRGIRLDPKTLMYNTQHLLGDCLVNLPDDLRDVF